ncbi:MAG: DUF5667 domain-containing protein [Candidatus Pacebacteria bacterium]|nr:DUF5667 domain-containing protein [Candidatus Paceibacterota bacterium]
MMKKNMEHNFLKKGIRALRRIRLSSLEKEAVLARLMEHVEKHPASVVSPWKIYVSHFRFHYAVASLLVMVLAGGSVTFAAEGALPGDVLYPVKLNITEPLQGALISGDLPKARFEAKKTLRRLEEAETLAAQGRLNQAAVETVETNFEKNASRFNVAIQRASTTASPEELVNAAVDFEAQVNAHVQILSVVGDAATSTLAGNIASLRGVVDESAEKAKGQRASAADVFISSSQDTADAAPRAALTESRNQGVMRATEIQKGDGRAQKRFDDKAEAIRTMIAATEDQLRDTATSTSAASSPVQEGILGHTAESLQTAQNALKEAEEKQGSGDSAQAFSALLDSESAAKQADTSLQQGLKLGREERASDDTPDRRSGDGSEAQRSRDKKGD